MPDRAAYLFQTASHSQPVVQPVDVLEVVRLKRGHVGHFVFYTAVAVFVEQELVVAVTAREYVFHLIVVDSRVSE